MLLLSILMRREEEEMKEHLLWSVAAAAVFVARKQYESNFVQRPPNNKNKTLFDCTAREFGSDQTSQRARWS
jgi:hypothetical protein